MPTFVSLTEKIIISPYIHSSGQLIFPTRTIDSQFHQVARQVEKRGKTLFRLHSAAADLEPELFDLVDLEVRLLYLGDPSSTWMLTEVNQNAGDQVPVVDIPFEKSKRVKKGPVICKSCPSDTDFWDTIRFDVTDDLFVSADVVCCSSILDAANDMASAAFLAKSIKFIEFEAP
ncbi:1-deoxy-D-xylulose 5-phosphate reductoisomerase [Striga asiatica]|uniref:1-deoxy-D-xylulose 5-phosphate reductoisomerase n=1 Tax=Striga asiatica TaxID=4170 RepID=A0A5A7QZN3_STRAF|nr:1-deoxy-D-xylulose 5-phosphate reductoisomerase [Striga asiatica]